MTTTATTHDPTSSSTTDGTDVDDTVTMWAAAEGVDRDGFSARMRRAYDPLFETFFAHPFLAGLRDGSLPAEVALHYVGQDHQYLTAFMRCYGLGMAVSPDRDWIDFFSGQVQFLLTDETHPHHVMCDAAGVSYEQAQVDRLAPSAQAYINHMTTSAHDSLGVLMAALMPCPWTYIWAASRQQLTDPVAADNPYAGWWEFYAGDECRALLAEFARRLDVLAAQAGPAELARMERAFEASCHHEIRFWQMAWTRETWESLPAALARR